MCASPTEAAAPEIVVETVVRRTATCGSQCRSNVGNTGGRSRRRRARWLRARFQTRPIQTCPDQTSHVGRSRAVDIAAAQRHAVTRRERRGACRPGRGCTRTTWRTSPRRKLRSRDAPAGEPAGGGTPRSAPPKLAAEPATASEAAASEGAQRKRGEASAAEAVKAGAKPDAPAEPVLVEVWRPGGRVAEERRPHHDRNRQRHHGRPAEGADLCSRGGEGAEGAPREQRHCCLPMKQ